MKTKDKIMNEIRDIELKRLVQAALEPMCDHDFEVKVSSPAESVVLVTAVVDPEDAGKCFGKGAFYMKSTRELLWLIAAKHGCTVEYLIIRR